MPTPEDLISDPLADEYEEYIEFQCPICQTPVGDDDKSCPGCGAIFVADEGTDPDPGLEEGELEVGYELDDDMDYEDIDEDALEAEIAAMEADLRACCSRDPPRPPTTRVRGSTWTSPTRRTWRRRRRSSRPSAPPSR